jgi:hypothetical protein
MGVRSLHDIMTKVSFGFLNLPYRNRLIATMFVQGLLRLDGSSAVAFRVLLEIKHEVALLQGFANWPKTNSVDCLDPLWILASYPKVLYVFDRVWYGWP